MAQPANTFDTYDSIGNREDLADVIYRIDPEEIPFTSNIGSATARAKKHEWQTQKLIGAVDTNANIEGDDATNEAVLPTVRVGNFTQISDKVTQLSGTIEAVDRAGRAGEMAYQSVLKGLELRRDIEKQMLSLKPSVVGSSSVAAESGGFGAWLTTNTSRGATGTNGGYNSGTGVVDAPGAGTDRPFTEALLKEVMLSCFNNGGRPTMCMLGGDLKQTFSTFSGIAETRRTTTQDMQTTIIGGADVYVSDFGNLTAVPHPYGMPAKNVYLIDPRMAAKAALRPMFSHELAKTGDSERRQVIEEYTLKVNNEAAHGVIADVTPS